MFTIDIVLVFAFNWGGGNQMVMPTIYVLPNCPRCHDLMTYLSKKHITYGVQNMSSSQSRAELLSGQCFALSAPVLRIGDAFYESGALWEGDKLNVGLLEGIL